jgi:tetratricopeptide (TPR) repeat protein
MSLHSEGPVNPLLFAPPLRTLLEQCCALWTQERCAEALALLPAQSDCPEETAILLAWRAHWLNALGQFSDALTACWQSLEHDATQPAARFEQGYALYMLDQREEACLTLETLLRAHPNYPDAAWLYAGILRQRRGDLVPEVRAAYQRACALDPDNRYAQVEYADVLRSHGEYTDALAIYTACQSREACPDEALRIEATFKRGLVALVLNDFEQARAAFRAVLDAAPDYPDAQAMYDLTCASFPS